MLLLTLRQKLVLSSAIFILFTLIVSGVSVYHFVRLGRAIDLVLVNNYTESMKEALEAQDAAVEAFIAGGKAPVAPLLTASRTRFHEQLELAAHNVGDGREKNRVDTIRLDYDEYERAVTRFLQTKESASALLRPYFNSLKPRYDRLKDELDSLLRDNQQAMTASAERAKDRAKRARLYTEIFSVAALILALVFSWQFIRLVVRPIQMLAKSAHDIAEGEWDQRIQYSSHDEIGLLAAEFNRMSVRLREHKKSDVGRILVERKKSEAVLDSLYEPVIVTDSAGNISRLNRAAEEAFGKEAGKSLNETALGERLLVGVKQAVEMQRPVANEEESALLPLRFGDDERSFRLRTTPLRDQDGRLSGAVTVLEDVTALREVDRFKTNFIQVASRKLRDPLQSVRLALYSLAHGHAEPLKPRQEEIVFEAEETADHLDLLITELLELAEIDSGARQLNLERIRPSILTREAFVRHAPQAEAKRITLEHKAYPDLPQVTADRRAVRAIFDNLLDNALEFTPSDGSIVIGAQEKEKLVIFYVRDTGPGIAANRLPRLFGRFVNDRPDGKGTGLGLAMVRRLAEAQGGQASVESRPGEGSTFTFTLPLAEVLPPWHVVEEG
ncbi:MAG TPA: ATP-binding protein [Candidatus Angelobacter sp.]|nr:ATP-binding protein [Candidatus Angelobacter sp.]